MLYGQEKTRQMARSVLPSTRRKGARVNAAILKRRNRAKTRQTLKAWKGEANAYDFEGHVFDYIYGWGPDQNIKINMWERRNGDKLGAIMHWAPKVTAHCEGPLERYAFMKRVLPDNLIGRHALGHIKFLDEFRVEYPHDTYYSPLSVVMKRNRERAQRSAAAVAEAADEILRVGGHALLNRRLREVHFHGHTRTRGWGENRSLERYNCEGCDLRLLHGFHDVGDFAQHVVEHASLHEVDLLTVYEVRRGLPKF